MDHQNKIENLQARVGVLERRREHLNGRLAKGDYRSAAAADFDRSEVAALSAGLQALRLHSAMLHPERNPVEQLRRLAAASSAYLSALEGDDDVNVDALEEALDRAIADSERVLEDLG